MAMFNNIRELTNSKRALEETNARVAEAEKQLSELENRIQTLTLELAEKEETIASRDEIIHAVHEQVTNEREGILANYAEREQIAKTELDEVSALLAEAEEHYADCERQVYCIANLYKSMRAGVAAFTKTGNPKDLELSAEEMEEAAALEQSVGLKLNSYQLADLKKMQEANNTLIEQLLARYETRLIVPADRVVFQLMTLGIRAELQQIISDMDYGNINRAQISLHLSVKKYLNIVDYANLAATGVLKSYAEELEVLLKETIKIEHEYLLRRHSYYVRQQMERDEKKNEK